MLTYFTIIGIIYQKFLSALARTDIVFAPYEVMISCALDTDVMMAFQQQSLAVGVFTNYATIHFALN
jgi:hypothetical protein